MEHCFLCLNAVVFQTWGSWDVLAENLSLVDVGWRQGRTCVICLLLPVRP